MPLEPGYWRLSSIPDSCRIALSPPKGGCVVVYDTETRRELYQLAEARSYRPIWLAFSERLVAATSYDSPEKDNSLLWLLDGATGRLAGSTLVDWRVEDNLCFSENGRHLVTSIGCLPLLNSSEEDERACLHVSLHWIMQGSVRLLLLPPAYWPFESAITVKGGTVALRRQAQVSFLEIDFSNTPWREQRQPLWTLGLPKSTPSKIGLWTIQ